MTYDTNQAIRLLISQAKALKNSVVMALSDSSTQAHNRYVSFKSFAIQYNLIAVEAEKVLNMKPKEFSYYVTEKMGNHMDTLWGFQKEIMESVNLSTGILIANLESYTEFTEDEFDNLENFFKSRLRTAIFSIPQKELEVQNAVESLLIGKCMTKGNDYDRESGKLEFSGKEYIPDFIISKLNLCIEVKLLREGKRSRIIDEINADITAYSTHYQRLMFIVYDLGVIRDESEFRRDIENAGEAIKVIIVKH